MKNYAMSTGKTRRWPRVLVIIAVALLAVILIAVLVIRRTYETNLQPRSNSSTVQQVTIPKGASVDEIATILEDADLIRAGWAFKWYVRTNDASDSLQAGSYPIRADQSIPEIVSVFTNGKVSTDLVTILPGMTIDEVKTTLINNGFSEDEVADALNPDNYADHPALVDKPKAASLEGYLYPESFQRTSATTAKQIVTASLDEMQKRLTPEVRASITKQGLTVYQGIILASIIEKEVSSITDKPTVAQVFLKRINTGMQLGSDVTALYGAQVDGVPLPEDPAKAAAVAISYDSPYNTRMHNGLPPGPISNFSEQSLRAVMNPTNTDYLFFVAGDPDENGNLGKTYFSRTLEEHEAQVQQYCKKLCN